MAISAATGRTSRRFRQLAKQVRARRRPCCICGEAIDYTLEWPHTRSFSVQHIKHRSTHPELAEDPSNLDAAHLECNIGDGNRYRSVQAHEARLGQRSRDW